MADGSVKISTELDNSGFESGVKDTRKTFTEMAKETGKSIEQIKDEVKSLAETYQKEGMNIPLSYKKAYATMGLYAKDAALEAEKSAEKISDAFEDSAKKTAKSYDKAGKTLESKLKSIGKAAGSAAKVGLTALAGAATAAVGGLLAVEAATEEYRIAQGKLNTAFEAAGYGPEIAAQAYKGFYEILGDTDTATEASQLLAKLADDAEDVSEWINIAAGVSGTFGDSLPIEGLIEASNETAKVGKVTGVLADALNWAGISEDDFNEKLAACTDETERNQLIMETLSGTYDEASEAFYRNNEALVASRDAQVQFTDLMAQIGGKVTEVKNALLEQFGPTLDDINQKVSDFVAGINAEDIANGVQTLIEKGTQLLPIITGIGAAFLAWKAVLIIQTAITAVMGFAAALKTASIAQLALNAAMAANPIGLVITILAGLIAALITLWNTNEDFRESVINAWNNIKTTVSGVVENIKKFFNTDIPAAWDSFKEKAGELKDNFFEAMTGIRDAAEEKIREAYDKIKGGLDDAMDYVKKLKEDAFTWGADMIGGLIDGVESKFEDLKTAAKEAADKVWRFLHFSRPEEGPLRDYETWMPHFIQGLVKGLESKSPLLGQSASRAAQLIYEGFKEKQDDTLKSIEDLIDDVIDELEDEDAKNAARDAGAIITDEYKKAMQSGLESVQNLVDTKITSLTNEFQQQYDAILQQQDMLSDKLAEGDLFTFDSENGLQIEDLDKTIDILNEYGKAIDELKSKDVSQAILDELAQLSPEEGLEAARYLLQLADESDDAFKALNDKWAQKQESAKEVAKKFYKDQLQTLKDDFETKLIENMEQIPADLESIGNDTIQGFMDGVNEKIPAAESLVRQFAEQMVQTIQSTMGIASPSKRTMWMGKMLDEGLAKGVTDNQGVVKSAINRMSVLDAFAAKIPSMQAAMTGFVSGMAPAYAGMSSTQTINRNTTQTVRIVADQQGIFDLVEAESKRRGKSLVSGKGLVTT